MKRYEYQYIGLDVEDDCITNLYELDHWGQDGWRVITAIKGQWGTILLLEREAPVDKEKTDERS